MKRREGAQWKSWLRDLDDQDQVAGVRPRPLTTAKLPN
jgi:hypothetical protein